MAENQLQVAPRTLQVLTKEQVDLVKRTVAVGATDDELRLFLHYCNTHGFDPLDRDVYFVKRKDKVAYQTSIDALRARADATGKYAGNDDPVVDDEQNPRKATVTVYKIIDGVRCGFTATARWEQYYPGDTQGFMWKKMPHLMLGKCAEALALRKAFPKQLGKIYVKEEMEQADVTPVSSVTATLNKQLKSTPPPVQPKPAPVMEAEVIQDDVPPPEHMDTFDDVPPERQDTSAGDYVIPFGKHKGKTIANLGMVSAMSYLAWLESDAAKKGEALKGEALNYRNHVKAFSTGKHVSQMG